MLSAAIRVYLILVVLSVLWSMKISEKWNKNRKEKSLTTGIQEMCQGSFKFGENNFQILISTFTIA